MFNGTEKCGMCFHDKSKQIQLIISEILCHRENAHVYSERRKTIFLILINNINIQGIISYFSTPNMWHKQGKVIFNQTIWYFNIIFYSIIQN